MSVMEEAGAFSRLAPEDTKKSGVDFAEVTSIKDPDNMGRVKCAIISAGKEKQETDWCFVASPFAGKGCGAFFHPNVGDAVIIAYEGGNVHRPCVIGSLWTKKNEPPCEIKDGKNEEYKIKTPKGLEFTLKDEKGKEQASITTPKGAHITLSDDGEKIHLSDKDNKTGIEMDLSKGALTLNAREKLVIKTGQSVITLESSGAVRLEGKNKIELSTTQFNLKATGTASLEATGEAKLKGSGSVSIESGGMAALKGTMVKIG